MDRTLQKALTRLTKTVKREAGDMLRTWQPKLERAPFLAGAINLAHYIALRHHDVRALQGKLTALGLSSLGRLESRVGPSLQAVAASLARIDGTSAPSNDLRAPVGRDRKSRTTGSGYRHSVPSCRCAPFAGPIN